MKLNWHSPLPPIRSGVADFTAAVLPALRERFTVELWADQETVSERIPSAPIRHMSRESVSDCDTDAVDVYNIGNNFGYHHGIFEHARTKPGIVLLHDTNLSDFFLGYQDKLRREGRSGEVGVLYETRVAATLEAWRAGTSVPEADLCRPLIRAALKNALCGVAFTPASFDHLRADPTCPAYRLDLPSSGAVSAGDGPDESIPGRLILFGFLGDNRRVPEILRAIANYPRREELTLHIYGTYHDPAGLEALIRTFDLERRVIVHGYAPDQVLDAAIRSAALVLNLRFPSMGEASVSQLRIWDLGKAAVTTSIGWYADLPRDAVLSAPLEGEQDALHACFTLALDDLAHLRALGENGRRRSLERHRPEHFAEAFAEVVADLPALRARWTVRRWTARAVAASAGWRAALPAAHWMRVTDAMARLAPAGFADPD